MSEVELGEYLRSNGIMGEDSIAELTIHVSKLFTRTARAYL